MKIDLIIGSLQSGGAERVISTLANHFASQGHEVSLITFGGEDKYEIHEKVNRVKLHKKLPFFNYALGRGLVNLFGYYRKKSNRPDVINSHISILALVTIPLAKLFGIKVISSEHINHSTPKFTLRKRFLWNYLYKFADAITVLTSYDVPFFSERNSKVVVMPNPNSFSSLKTQNLNRDKTMLAIGNLDRYHHKGFDNLIDISKKIKTKVPGWKLKIVGEGKEGREFLENKIAEANVEDFVTLLGFRSDIPELLQSSSIYILSSRYEGLPMVLIEAGSQGITSIAYDCISGPSEVIENNVNGILIEDQDHDMMAENIIQLANDDDLRKRLGEKALEYSNRFSIDKIGAKWEQLFHEIQ